jgi:hypothetical protein
MCLNTNARLTRGVLAWVVSDATTSRLLFVWSEREERGGGEGRSEESQRAGEREEGGEI